MQTAHVICAEAGRGVNTVLMEVLREPFLENSFFIGSLRSSINTVLTPLPASAQITWAVCKDEESGCECCLLNVKKIA